MEMLVIYDTTGRIYYCAGGNIEEPKGLPFLRVTIPQGKTLVKVDTTGDTATAVFEDVPKSEYEQRLDDLNNQLLDTQEALAAIYESMEV